MNMPTNFLNGTNIKNFHTILKMFCCKKKEMKYDIGNERNDALKIFLSDKLSTVCTKKHDKFINKFLPYYNSVVKSNPDKVVTQDYHLRYKDFVCEVRDDFNIEAHCMS